MSNETMTQDALENYPADAAGGDAGPSGGKGAENSQVYQTGNLV